MTLSVSPLVRLAVLALAWAALAGAAQAAPMPDPDEAIDVVLSLAGARERALEQFVAEVSDPASPRYRQYISIEEIARRFGAPARARAAVTAYLEENGARASVDPTGSFVFATLPRRKAERLFGSADPRIPSRRPRTASSRGAGVPPALAGLVDAVIGLDERLLVQPRASTAFAVPGTPLVFEQGSSARRRSGTAKGCAAGRQSAGLGTHGFTPNQWLRAYGIADLHRRGLRGQGQRLAVVEIDGFARSDLVAAARCFGYSVPPVRLHLAGIERPLPPGGETTLDLQVIAPIAPRLASLDVFEGVGTAVGLVELFAAPLMLPPRQRPTVISSSIGQCESTYSGSMAFLRALERLFMAAAASGITVVSAAGDSGSSDCDFTAAGNPLGVLEVDYPGSSPYVTSVGGTNLVLDWRNRILKEIVWNDNPLRDTEKDETILTDAGGGGQSVVFTRPWWQRGPGIGGPSRLVPDVSFLADLVPGYAIHCTPPACRQGGFRSVGGTSAAAPLLAAAVALANQDAARAGQPPLGTINPLLYALARSPRARTIFNDVVRGSNDIGRWLPATAGGGAPLGCCAARRGFDRASGWGSMDLSAFSAHARRAFALAR